MNVGLLHPFLVQVGAVQRPTIVEEEVRSSPYEHGVITGHGDVSASVMAMKAGAVDFLEKPVKGAALIDAIRRASERSFNLQATNAEIEALKDRYETLTPREREVFSLVTAGLLNKQAAAELGIAEKTIKQHRGQVVEKMAAESLADLVLMAERLGIRPSGIDFTKAKGKLIPQK